MKKRPHKSKNAASVPHGKQRQFGGGGANARRRRAFLAAKKRRGGGARWAQRSIAWKKQAKPRMLASDTKVQTEVSAGGIVFRRTPRGIRIGFILDPYGKWGFAKGHVEPGEEIIDAAVRETREEMGLQELRVVAPLGTIDFWFRDRYRPESKGTLVHKYVHYFLMEASPAAKGRPQHKEKIRRIIWVGLRRSMRTSNYQDLRPVLDHLREHFRGQDGDDASAPADADAPEPSADGGDLQLY